MLTSSTVPTECQYPPRDCRHEARVRILVYIYLLISPHWVPMPPKAYMKWEYIYWYIFTYSSVPTECQCRPRRTWSESTYTGIYLLTHLPHWVQMSLSTYMKRDYVYWYMFTYSSVPIECQSPHAEHEVRVHILVYIYLLICPHWVSMSPKAYLKREYVYWYIFTYSSVPIEYSYRQGRTGSEGMYTGPCEGPGVKTRMCPPYPQRDRKRRLNWAVCRNHRIKRLVPCRC